MEEQKLGMQKIMIAGEDNILIKAAKGLHNGLKTNKKKTKNT